MKIGEKITVVDSGQTEWYLAFLAPNTGLFFAMREPTPMASILINLFALGGMEWVMRDAKFTLGA